MSGRPLYRHVCALCLGYLALVSTGCHLVPQRSHHFPTAATGRVLGRADVCQLVPRAIMGDEAYAEVNSQWLPGFYTRFRTELSRLGVVNWDRRFDCNRFAELYTGVAQIAFFREAFHSSIKAQALAVGPLWYRRDNDLGAHAIVQVLTERGIIYIDPQTGAQIQLTPQELASAYLQVI